MISDRLLEVMAETLWKTSMRVQRRSFGIDARLSFNWHDLPENNRAWFKGTLLAAIGTAERAGADSNDRPNWPIFDDIKGRHLETWGGYRAIIDVTQPWSDKIVGCVVVGGKSIYAEWNPDGSHKGYNVGWSLRRAMA